MDDIVLIRLTSLLREKESWFKHKAKIAEGHRHNEVIHDICSQMEDFFRTAATILRGE